MIVAGVMSGTSADGIDVALVRLGPQKRSTRRGGLCPRPSLELLGHAAFPYSRRVRSMVLSSMNSPSTSVADLARLNFLLGELYADAVLSAQKKFRVKAELVGCHGQTIYHQGTVVPFLGKQLAATWQTGEGSVIAARVGVPVVSDFRPADIAAGGKGAPLVPYFDYLFYRSPSIGRIALNIGGIANLTAIPASSSLDQLIAFDTGPGNMVMDALTEQLFGNPFDRDGKIAASGRVHEEFVLRLLRAKFFRQTPPKTAGREEFGREFTREFLRGCGFPQARVAPDALVRGGRTRASAPTRESSGYAAAKVDKGDIIATATALTARSIGDALRRFVLPRGSFSEVIASGGGTWNPTLMSWLANELRELGLHLRSSDEFGIPSEAKEAVAFAVLAFETWNRRPSNVPSATGATRAAVLGKISFP